MTTIGHKTRDLIGSPAQLRWAREIRADFLKMAGGDASLLPQVPAARFWIDARSITSILELHEAALEQSCERLSRHAAVDALPDRGGSLAACPSFLHIAVAFREGYLYSSPFTIVYPRSSRAEAQLALQVLDRFMVLDLETDGIGKQAQILEIAVVDQFGSILLSSLIQPPDMSRLESRATEKALSANGITADMVRDAPPLSDIWTRVVEVVTEPGNGCLTTFNAAFDVAILRNCGQREGLLTPSLTAVCAMRLATAFFEREFYPSLDEAATLAGISRNEQETSHRAVGDAKFTARVIHRLRLLSQNNPRF